MKNVFLRFAGIAFMLAGSPLAPGAGFTVSPVQITNDYVGKITFNLTTSLTNVGTVLIEKYADLNTNGLVDPGEPLMQSFTVRDGALPFIGEGTNRMRNLNVPGDEDGATNGQMRIELFYPGVDPAFDRIEGHFVYRISHPTNAFTATSQTFTVWQKWQPQGLRICVTNASGIPMTNAMVLLGQGDKNKAQGGTLLNSDGWYTLFTPPTNWTVMGSQTGYVGPMGGSLLTVSSNLFVTSGVVLIAGSNLVSGRVCDATNGPGLGGVAVYASSPNNLLAFTYTDANGDYTLNLTTNQWRIGYNPDRVALLGRVGLDKGVTTNVTGNISNLNLQVYKAEGLIHGLVTDDQTNRLTNIVLWAYDIPDHLFSCQGISYPTAGTNTYCIGVVAGTNWWVGPDEDLLPPGYFGHGTNVAIGSNQTLRVDFVLQHYTSYLRGRVVNESTQAVTNINVSTGPPNGGPGWHSTRTDANGEFNLGVTGGTNDLNVEATEAGNRGYVAPQIRLNVTNGVDITDIILLLRNSNVCLTVVVKDDASNAIAGIQLYAVSSNGETNYFAWGRTDTNGRAPLGVFPGDWQISLMCNDLDTQGYPCPNNVSITVPSTNVTTNIVVCFELRILTTNLPDAYLGVPYTNQLVATGGQEPYSWTKTLGLLPPGLSLTSDGIISGIPTMLGTNYFTMRVTDSTPGNPASATQALSITVKPALVVATAHLPFGTNGWPYWAQLQAAGGDGHYSWSLAPTPYTPLPPGLRLSADGALSGVPMTPPAFYLINVRVADTSTNAEKFLALPIMGSTNTTPPELSVPVRLSDSSLQLCFTTLAGSTYTVQHTLRLECTPGPTNCIDCSDWVPLVTISGMGGPMTIVDPNATNRYRFYRVLMR